MSLTSDPAHPRDRVRRPLRRSNSGLPRLCDAPLDLLAKRGGEPLDGRKLRVDLAGFKPRDSGLRRTHARCDQGLREAQLLASCSKFAQQLSTTQRCLDEVGELGVPLAALVDDLVDEVWSVSHAPHYSVHGISPLRLRLASAPPVSEPPLSEPDLLGWRLLCLLREALEREQDPASAAPGGEQDAVRLSIAVGSHLVDVAAKPPGGGAPHNGLAPRQPSSRTNRRMTGVLGAATKGHPPSGLFHLNAR